MDITLLILSRDVVVNTDAHMPWIPRHYLRGTKSANVKRRREGWVDGSLGWNESDDTLVEHRHDNVLNEGPACLVDIGAKSEAFVQPGLHWFEKTTLLVEPHMLDVYCSRVRSDAIVNRGDHRALVAPREPDSVRARAIRCAI